MNVLLPLRVLRSVRPAAVFVVLFALFGLIGRAAAQTPPPPSGGTPLLGQDTLRTFAVVGQQAGVEVTRVPVTGQPFPDALRLRTRAGVTFPNEYAVQIQATPTGSVKKGDVLLARHVLRVGRGGRPARNRPVHGRRVRKPTSSAALVTRITAPLRSTSGL